MVIRSVLQSFRDFSDIDALGTPTQLRLIVRLKTALGKQNMSFICFFFIPQTATATDVSFHMPTHDVNHRSLASSCAHFKLFAYPLLCVATTQSCS